MPALKRKFAKSKFTAPRKKRRVAITNKPYALSLDHKVLRLQQKAVLRYHEDFALNPGPGGVPGFYAFRANSIYDPDASGVGHQPRGYDQLAALYKYVRVDEVQIELWSDCPNDGNPKILSITCESKQDTALSTPSRQKMMETANASFKSVSNTEDTHFTSLRAKPWKIGGIKQSEDVYRHNKTSNPTEVLYLNVRGMPIDSSVDSANINCVARITYHCTFTDPEMPTAS